MQNDILSLTELLNGLPELVKKVTGLKDKSDVAAFVMDSESAWGRVVRYHSMFNHEKFATDTTSFLGAMRDHLVPLLEDYTIELVKISVFHRYISECHGNEKYRVLSPASAETLMKTSEYAEMEWNRDTCCNFGLFATLAVLNNPKVTLGNLKQVYRTFIVKRDRVGTVFTKSLIETFIDSGLIRLSDLAINQFVQSHSMLFEDYWSANVLRATNRSLYPKNTPKPRHSIRNNSRLGIHLLPLTIRQYGSCRLYPAPINELLSNVSNIAIEMQSKGRIDYSSNIFFEAVIDDLVTNATEIFCNAPTASSEELGEYCKIFDIPKYNRHSIGDSTIEAFTVCDRYSLPLQFSILSCIDAVPVNTPLYNRILQLGRLFQTSDFMGYINSIPRRVASGILSEDGYTDISYYFSSGVNNSKERHLIGNSILSRNIVYPSADIDIDATMAYNMTSLVSILTRFVRMYDTTDLSMLSKIENYDEKYLITATMVKFLREHNPIKVFTDLGYNLKDDFLESDCSGILNPDVFEDIQHRANKVLNILEDYIAIPFTLILIRNTMNEDTPIASTALVQILDDLISVTRTIALKVIPNVLISVGPLDAGQSNCNSLAFSLTRMLDTLYSSSYPRIVRSENESGNSFKDGYVTDRVFKAHMELFEGGFEFNHIESIYEYLRITIPKHTENRIMEAFMVGEIAIKAQSPMLLNFQGLSERSRSNDLRISYLNLLEQKQLLDLKAGNEFLANFSKR